MKYPMAIRSERAAAPGRHKQGPTLSEGRLSYSASGVSQ